MHIKQIVIQGFKSYREQSALKQEFSPNHNVVVGRNGSGKSNFFWAIRFVLNDAYNSLSREERQSLLHDGAGNVAFSAHVEITFDNQDGRFPTGKKETVIRRTIGMKKDEYSLDRKSATKQEIKNLLESAGLSGVNPYYIVPQGRITALCSQKEEDRLNLFKDVAGTGVYEQRRQESSKMLEETVTKREEIDNLMVYIEKRLVNLDEEKKGLQEYTDLDKERRSLEYAMYQHELEQVQQEMDEAEVQNKQKSNEQSSINNEIQNLTQERDELRQKRKEYEQKIKRNDVERKIIQREMKQNMIKLSDLDLKQDDEEIRIRKQIQHINHALRQNLDDEELKRIDELISTKQKILESISSSTMDLDKTLIFETKKQLLRQQNRIRMDYEEGTQKVHNLLNKVYSQMDPRTAVALKAIKKLNLNIYGPLYKLIDVDSIFFSAVEQVAGSSLFSVVVDTEETATLVLDQLKNLNCKITLIPLNQITTKPSSNILCSKIRYDPMFKSIIHMVFGKTELRESLDYSSVTINGDSCDKKGAITGGFRSNKRIQNLLMLRNLEVKLDGLKQELSEIGTKIQVLNQQLVMCSQNKVYQQLESEIKDLRMKKTDSTVLQQEKLQLELKAKQIQRNVLSSQNQQIQSSRQTISELDASNDELRTTIISLDQNLEQISNSLFKLEKKLDMFQDRIKVLQIKKRLSERKQKISYSISELGVLPDNFKKHLQSNQNKILSELRKVREKLRGLGQINKKAFDQFQSFSKQLESLFLKRTELETSHQSILELIDHLDLKKTEALQHTFDVVSSHFSKLWRELVGSDGELIMNDQGIGIKVSFSDTYVSSMSQLSGGQKSLVALCLIFSIQKHDPAPFYLFDEIDANLDQVYRQNVARLLFSLSRSAQFITTTFRPELLENADAFFAVSYSNKVSSVHSIDKQQALGFIQLDPV